MKIIKHPLAVFLFCFFLSFFLLYLLAGGIWGNPESTPLKVEEPGEENKPTLKIKAGKQELKFYAHHKIKGGRYYHYEEKTGRLDFELHFSEVSPLDESDLSLKDPRCVHYPEEKTSEKTLEVPRKLVIQAKTARLRIDPKTRKFVSIVFDDRVRIQGYEKETGPEKDPPMTLLETERVVVHFLEKTLENDAPIFLHERNRHGEDVFLLKAVGVKGEMKMEKLVFKKEVWVKFYAKLWEGKEDRPEIRELDMPYAISRCKGMAQFVYSRKQKRLRLSLEEDVKMEGNGATIECQKMDAHLLQSKEEKRLEIEWIEARGNVVFQDGQRDVKNQATADEFRMDKEGEKTTLSLRRNPVVQVHDLEDFTVLPPKVKKQLQKEQSRRQFTSLEGKCKKEIRWIREKNGNSGQWEETFEFSRQVYLKQTAEKIKLLTLECEESRLALKMAENRRRKPAWLTAEGNVIIHHEKGQGKGGFFKWEKGEGKEYRLFLKENPSLYLEDVESGGMMGKDLFSLENQKKATAKKAEDILVTAVDPMVMEVKQEGGGSKFEYRAQKNVRLVRYDAVTRRETGNLTSDTLSLVAASRPEGPAPSEKPEKKENLPGAEKLDIHSLEAKGNVVFSGDGIEGRGNVLKFRQMNGKNFLSLSEDCWIKNEQGKLVANEIVYHGDKEAFRANGSPVRLFSKEMKAEGKSLYYFKKDDRLLLVGELAYVEHLDRHGQKKDSLEARRIYYWRSSGRMRAQERVSLFFTADSGQMGSFDQMGLFSPKGKKESGKKREEGKEKPPVSKKYRLTAESFATQMNPETREIQSFRVAGNMEIKKEPTAESPESEGAKGEWMVYRDNILTLYGAPAAVEYDGNFLYSNKMIGQRKNRTGKCEGPVKMKITNPKGMASPVSKKSNRTIFIESEGPLVFQDEKNVELQKNVVVRTEDAVLWCDRLKMVMEENRLSSLSAFENVKIKARESTVLADHLHWSERNKLAFLTGYPLVNVDSKDFKMQAPLVWYHIEEERFLIRGRETLVERLPTKTERKK